MVGVREDHRRASLLPKDEFVYNRMTLALFANFPPGLELSYRLLQAFVYLDIIHSSRALISQICMQCSEPQGQILLIQEI